MKCCQVSGHGFLLVKGQTIAVDSRSGALTPGNRLGLEGHHESRRFPDLTYLLIDDKY